MVFALVLGEKVQLAVYNTRLLTGPWQNAETAALHLNGLTVEAVWNNVLLEVSGVILKGDNTFEKQVAEDDAQRKLLNQIEKLEAKARKETQPRKKLELIAKIKELKKELL